ncbi:MAG: NAD(P)-dependent oxidoreductase, partial [Lentisphaeria bacterium]|nr:NAD(P)-dependent oxidoreductase [Lentisphaeria bacterium]
INVARGAIVDQAALARALAEKRICGAGLDAFDPEPIAPDDPLLALDNVVLTPHALGHTVEMVNQCSEMCVAGVWAVARGQAPGGVVNRAVLDRPKLKAKLEAFRQRFDSG